MAKNNQDTLARAYAKLSSLRKHIGQMSAYSVDEKYVTDFHSVLVKLKGIGIEVSEFRIPDSELKPRVVSSKMKVRDLPIEEPIYSREKYADKSFILTKLDAILGYFEIITSEKPKKIGFSKPENQ